MVIKYKKGEKCPICHKKVISPNCWVNYHVNYDPPIVITACKWCNFAEFVIRNKYTLQFNKFTNERIPYVKEFHKKYGYII